MAVDILRIFRDVSQALLSEFAVVRSIPQTGESGRATEDALRAFLERHLPARFGVATGFAIALGGMVSSQSDILLVDTMNSLRLLRAGNTALFPYDGVVARIEVTQNLTAEKRRTDAERIRAFRALPSSFNYEADFEDSSPLGLMFAQTADASLEACGQWLLGLFAATARTDRRLLPNSIMILDRGLVTYQQNGGVTDDPTRATGVIGIGENNNHLLLWLLYLLYRIRVLIEHRIRANTKRLLSVRYGELFNEEQARDYREPYRRAIIEAAGADPYFLDLLNYIPPGRFNDLFAAAGGVQRFDLE